MELIKQGVQVLSWNGLTLEDCNSTEEIGERILRHLELAGRLCYKSEEKIGDFDKTKKLIEQLHKSGHHSVLEHAVVSVRFISNRGMTHELVRHRLANYSQESTRYCNYGNDHVKFIIPPWAKNLEPCVINVENKTKSVSGVVNFIRNHFDDLSDVNMQEYEWLMAMAVSEFQYKRCLKEGLGPQFARGVLPIDLKTEIIMTANLREWMHVFNMRASQPAHPQIRELARELLVQFKSTIPVMFDDQYERFIREK